jgi:hypothetical protein
MKQKDTLEYKYMWKNSGNENFHLTIPRAEYDRLITPEDCGNFSCLDSIIPNDARCTQKINLGLPW